MSLRSVLPVIVLSVLSFATGCADNTSDSDDTEASGGAEQKPAAKEGAKGGASGSKDGTAGAGSTGAAPKAPRVHEGEPPPAQQLPANDPEAFAQQREAAVKQIVDGTAADGITSFVLDRGTSLPVIFRVASSAVKEIADGFEVHGNLTLETPVGPLSLFAADVVFERGPSGNLERLVGSVEIPAPSLGAFEGFETDAPIRGTIGYDFGKNLADKLEAPMLDDRKYIAFDYAMGLGASAGSAEISFAGGKSGTMVLDPEDPSFYLTGGLVGLDAVGPLEDLAMGLSARGLLAFKPNVTWGVTQEAKEFSGHLYAKGTVNLRRLPVSIDGELVVNIDASPFGGQGRRLGTGTPEGVELGANGQLNLVFDAKVASIKLPLAKASMGARITSSEQHAYISGEIGPDTDWLPTVMPFVPSAQARVAAFIDSDLSKSHLNAETDFALKANKLYGVIPGLKTLNLSDIPVAKATLDADQTGLRITGSVKTPNIPVIKAQAGLTAEAFLPANDPGAFFFQMNGNMSLGDFPLGTATARIDRNGFLASGSFKTPVSEISMSGAITSSGAAVDGKLVVDLKGLQSVTQTVTDGLVCGYDHFTNGTICGWDTVTSGTVCGWDYVTDGAKCGTETIGNCLGGLFSGSTSGCTSSPKSCNIAKSCSVAKSCDRAKTCQTKVNVPNMDFGHFEGNLHVVIAGDHASASVQGQLCSGGSCSSIGSAKVTLGSNPQVCFGGLPGAVGDICAKF